MVYQDIAIPELLYLNSNIEIHKLNPVYLIQLAKALFKF